MKQYKKKKMKNSLIWFCLFVTLISYTQNYEGLIDTVENGGFYKITLTPDVRSAANENFSYLRIINNKSEEIPYVLINESGNRSDYDSVPIISRNINKDSISSILIENKGGVIKKQVVLQIANTKVTKYYNVYGSNDKKQWFGLVSNEVLSNINDFSDTKTEKVITYPLHNYQFLRIDFDDTKSLPINIIGAGVYSNNLIVKRPLVINDFQYSIEQIKEKKVTQLKFTASKPHKISAISLDIKTDLYSRNAKVLIQQERKIKKRIEKYYEELAYFQLSSKNQNNTIVLDDLKAKEFLIEIENEDNQPLDIQKVTAYQNPLTIVAKLQQKEAYKIIVDTTLNKPSYDLENFIADHTLNAKEIAISQFSKIENNKKGSEEKPFWQTTVFMWLCIILGGATIIYFTLTLLKDMSKEENG